MATSSTGPADAGAAATSDFDALARQYWQAWGDAMRNSGVAATAAGSGTLPGWQDAIDWWSRLAQGGKTQANATLDRFNAQARDWYGAMQQVAAQFAGQQPGANDIATEWKRALGAIGTNPFPEMFKAMRGPGAQGLEQWVEAASPWLESLRREGATWLGMPAFGIGRERQQRLQQLMQAQLDCQQREAAYNALMLKAVQRAHEVFTDKLAEHEQPGQQLTSARALFDLWIDAAEEAYAGIALSPEFREIYAALVNAQMRLRQGVHREVEQASAMFGMPTRSEVDAAYRKIAELERAMRRMRDAINDHAPDAALKPRARRGAGPSDTRRGDKKPTIKRAASRAPAKRAPAKKKKR